MLKIIGITAMLSDHVGKVFFPELIGLQYFGRLAFPIFCFLIAQGYLHTKDIKKYTVRLIIFAAISQIPYMLFLSTYYNGFEMRLNVIFTLFLGLATIFFVDNFRNVFYKVSVVLLAGLVAEIFNMDYGAYGIELIVLFYFFSKIVLSDRKLNRKKKIFCEFSFGALFALITILKYLDRIIISIPDTTNIMLAFWTVATFFVIVFYNGKLGRKCKYLFYVFYPTHLIVIYLVYNLVRLN